MGRRKKEPANVHRAAIAAAAERLFTEKGIGSTTVEEIAKEAGYSKATLYVYFKNKEEITGVLVLESMKKLYGYMSLALEKKEGTRSRYDAICTGLCRYQEEFPFYFQIVLKEVNVDFQAQDFLPVEKEIYNLGEQINDSLAGFLQGGIEAGEIRPDLDIMSTVFSFWAMLSGLVLMASEKEVYIEKRLKLSRQEFLQYGFDTLYRSIGREEAVS